MYTSGCKYGGPFYYNSTLSVKSYTRHTIYYFFFGGGGVITDLILF